MQQPQNARISQEKCGKMSSHVIYCSCEACEILLAQRGTQRRVYGCSPPEKGGELMVELIETVADLVYALVALLLTIHFTKKESSRTSGKK
jgi:hypothetical protein